jgi:hypothetical protein
MNTMGKILVILNLLFALVTGAFLAFDFATRTNWKRAYDDLEAEMKVSRTNVDTQGETRRVALTKLQDALARLDATQKALEEQKKKAVKDLAEAHGEMQSADQDKVKSEILQKAQVGELGRLQAEIKSLSKALQERDQTIVTLNQEKSKALDNLLTAVAEKEAAISRSESLLDQNRELSKKLATTQVAGGAKAGAGAPMAKEGQPNPPPTYVRAKVEKVDPESPTVGQIDAGSDEGLAEGQTLEAYRLGKASDYLGSFLILRVNHHKAVGRLLPPRAGEPRRELKVGDEVASSIGPH